MLDIKFIRQNPEAVKEGCKKKQVNVDIDQLIDVDRRRRETIQALEDMRAEKNKASKIISQNSPDKDKIILEMRELDINSDRLTKTLKDLEAEFVRLMTQIPNLPLEEVPVGADEKENIVLREVGKKPNFGFEARDYMQLSENFDLIDIKRAGKASGTRFGYIKNEAALLEFAVVQLVFNTLIKEKFVPIVPPVMIKSEMMKAMGYIDSEGDKAERYYFENDDLYLVGTSEQSVGPMHADEVFVEKDLPRRYVAFSSCFRREAGAYGKDTKGILRVHQFDKLEMFSFCKPEDSKKEHELILKMEEKLMQALEIPYRVVQLCTGDLARPSAATFDIEAWMPGQNQYRETHSSSNCTEFQARRLNIRYRNMGTNGLEFVHTLNGTAFAIGRILIAIIENNQQKDGSIKIPKVLQKFVGKGEIKN